MSSSPAPDADTAAAVPSDAAPTLAPSPTAQGSSETLARSAGLVSVAVMASRLLGVVRDQALLIHFGAGAMDAFNVAFRFPNLVRDLFAEGAMSAAFVPAFTRELKSRGREAAWEVGNLVISALIVATGVIVIAGILGAAPLTYAIAGDYAEVPGKIELTITLTRIMFPFLTLVAVAVAVMGMLNSLRHFFIPALAPAMFNVFAILSIYAIVPFMGGLGWHAMVGLAIGTLLGGIGQVAVQWPSLRREGYRFRFMFAPSDPRLREVLWLMAPGTMGLAAVQVNQLVNVWLATGAGEGAVTYLQMAFRLIYLPIGLFGVSIATAALPGISRHAADNDTDGVRESLSQALRMMLMLNVPATFGLVALARPIIQMLVEYGDKMTPRDTTGIAFAVICYAPGLVGYSVVKIASPTFYALKDSATPVKVSMTAIALNLALNLLFVWVFDYGYGGLALGTGIAALINASLLLWLLRARLHGLDGRRVGVALIKILIASLVMAAAAWGTERVLHDAWPGESVLHRGVRVGLAVGVGLATLALTAKLLRLHEFERAFGRVVHRLAGRLRAADKS